MSDMFLHKIDEYKYSKIKPKFSLFNKNECELYAPHTYKGMCRLCLQTPATHKRWFEYSLNCIKIQNCWRRYILNKLLKQFRKIYLSNLFCEDISFYISELLTNNEKLKDNVRILRNLLN